MPCGWVQPWGRGALFFFFAPGGVRLFWQAPLRGRIVVSKHHSNFESCFFGVDMYSRRKGLVRGCCVDRRVCFGVQGGGRTACLRIEGVFDRRFAIMCMGVCACRSVALMLERGGWAGLLSIPDMMLVEQIKVYFICQKRTHDCQVPCAVFSR